MVTYNIEIREFNGVDYDILHPITTIENVEGLNNSLTQLNQNITNINNTLPNKVNKAGDTMTGNLTMERSIDPSIYFKQRNDSRGYIFLRDNQFYFSEYAQDQQQYREAYTLPMPSTGMTSSKFYRILTSKNLDTTPTADSANPVTSGGVKTAVDGKVSKSGDTMTGNLTVNGRITGNDRFTLYNGSSFLMVPKDTTTMASFNLGIKNNNQGMLMQYKTGISGADCFVLPVADTSISGNNYFDILTSKNFDDVPTDNSNNPVKSKGIKTALDGKVSKSGDTMTGNLGIEKGYQPSLKLKQSNTSLGAVTLSNNQIFFREYPADQQQYSEVYRLPIADSGLTATKWYEILTSKTPVTVAQGGTGITSNPSMLVNLASTSASNVFATSPRPGVTGVLPIANGGTGANNKKNALSNLGVTISNTAIAEGSTLASGSIYIYYE